MLYRKDYISWDECFMQMAKVISERSKDPSTQAGAVLVDDQNVVVGLGYNGFPRGIDNDDLPWERKGSFLDTKYAYIVHAEENAIYNANARTNGCILYCTLFPCNECVKTIIQNGIKEIVFSGDKYHNEESWVASRKMLDLAGVSYRQYQTKDKKDN
ncbi:dCMP deaminase family protein [Patescibacteria group bacterium]|nr:dCMP deaminase family protein [Patescibacteria group bacterium]